jgi:hypothetical protein
MANSQGFTMRAPEGWPTCVTPRATADVAMSCPSRRPRGWSARRRRRGPKGQRKAAGARRITVSPWRPARYGRRTRRSTVSVCLARRHPWAAASHRPARCPPARATGQTSVRAREPWPPRLTPGTPGRHTGRGRDDQQGNRRAPRAVSQGRRWAAMPNRQDLDVCDETLPLDQRDLARIRPISPAPITPASAPSSACWMGISLAASEYM